MSRNPRSPLSPTTRRVHRARHRTAGSRVDARRGGSAARGSSRARCRPSRRGDVVARGIEHAPAVHEEATLAARGIEPGTTPAIHEEATLVARGIEHAPALHDEATLVARGIDIRPSTTRRRPRPRHRRGHAGRRRDTGSGIEFPSIEPATAAAVTGALAGQAAHRRSALRRDGERFIRSSTAEGPAHDRPAPRAGFHRCSAVAELCRVGIVSFVLVHSAESARSESKRTKGGERCPDRWCTSRFRPANAEGA